MHSFDFSGVELMLLALSLWSFWSCILIYSSTLVVLFMSSFFMLRSSFVVQACAFLEQKVLLLGLDVSCLHLISNIELYFQVNLFASKKHAIKPHENIVVYGTQVVVTYQLLRL